MAELPGQPDLVFKGPRVVVFCDGNFWHGRDWESRRKKLMRGTNPGYWVAKIERNIERDQRNRQALERSGWIVLRFWESEIVDDIARVVRVIADVVIEVESQRSVREVSSRH